MSMQLDEANSLTPEKVLRWTGWNKPTKGTVGETAHQMWGKSCGETVRFIGFTGQKDMCGFPIINVETKRGLEKFSSAWFE